MDVSPDTTTEYVYDGTTESAKCRDVVFWRYNPNLCGVLMRLDKDTFTIRWPGKGRKKYPRYSWMAIGFMHHEEEDDLLS